MEQLDELLYDDVEAKYLALQNKKKKRKKRRRKRRLVIAGAILLVASLYFMSDISKVKSLEVKGNRFYTKEDVLKKAHLSYETRYMITPKCYHIGTILVRLVDTALDGQCGHGVDLRRVVFTSAGRRRTVDAQRYDYSSE